MPYFRAKMSSLAQSKWEQICVCQCLRGLVLAFLDARKAIVTLLLFVANAAWGQVATHQLAIIHVTIINPSEVEK